MMRKILGVILSVVAITGTAWQPARAINSIDIYPTNRQQITGWGIYTENRPDWSPVEDFNISKHPLACDALYGPQGIGANVLRLAFPPQSYVADGVLDANIMNGMKAHVMAALNRGVDKWFVSLWTPPASMKTIETTAGTTDGTPNVNLREDSEDRFVQYCADLLNWMKSNGVPLPHSFSFQNEPGWHPPYDGCTYDVAQYQRVTKKLRAKFDASGLSSVLLNCNDGAHQKDTMERLGLGPKRDDAFDTDASLRNAVGVISTHTYDLHNGLFNWYSKGLQEYYEATRDRPQEKWMTEWEVVTNGDFKVTNEWDILRENIRHFNRDLSTLQFNTWVYWQTWYAKDPTNLDHKKTFVNGTTAINRNTSYYMFRKIWRNAPPTGGTYMRQVTTTDPDLKGASFSNWHQDFSCFVNGDKMVLVVSNPTGTDKTLDIKGVVGSRATLYRYTSGQAADYNKDMTEVATYSISKGNLSAALIAANSVNVFVTSGLGTAVTAKKATATKVAKPTEKPKGASTGVAKATQKHGAKAQTMAKPKAAPKATPPAKTKATPTVTPARTSYIYLKANVNSKYITATEGGFGPLLADSTTRGAAQKFEKIVNTDGTISFKATLSGKYVTANGESSLVADSTSIGASQKFTRVASGDGYSYKAANGQFVKASEYHSPRYALAAVNSSAGSWETFFEEN